MAGPRGPRAETALRDGLAELIGRRAQQYVRNILDSRTLKDALRLQKSAGRWWLGVPHYWAVYYHDGRMRATPRRAKWLVWYPNPHDDPRHYGNYPVRSRDIQRLDIPPEQLYDDIQSGRAVIAKMSPRSGGVVRGKRFFERGLRFFFSGVGVSRQAYTDRWRTYLRATAPDILKRRRARQRIIL